MKIDEDLEESESKRCIEDEESKNRRLHEDRRYEPTSPDQRRPARAGFEDLPPRRERARRRRECGQVMTRRGGDQLAGGGLASISRLTSVNCGSTFI